MALPTLLAAASTFVAVPAYTSRNAAARIDMRFSWTPPPPGTPGRPIESPSAGEEHAMVERAAAAANAGITGYHTDYKAIDEVAASGDSGCGDDSKCRDVDIWTFGMQPEPLEGDNLFDKIKSSLPLSLKKLLQ